MLTKELAGIENQFSQSQITKTDEKGSWGAFELGLRYSEFDASDFKSILTPSTATTSFASEANAWMASAKWILNPNAHLMLHYIYTKFDTHIRVSGKLNNAEDAVVLKAQYDF